MSFVSSKQKVCESVSRCHCSIYMYWFLLLEQLYASFNPVLPFYGWCRDVEWNYLQSMYLSSCISFFFWKLFEPEKLLIHVITIRMGTGHIFDTNFGTHMASHVWRGMSPHIWRKYNTCIVHSKNPIFDSYRLLIYYVPNMCTYIWYIYGTLYDQIWYPLGV